MPRKQVGAYGFLVFQADLVSRLDRKLKVLRDEQVALAEEAAVNEALGVSVADRVKTVAKPQEANKFRTHVQEVGHITSLLLSLSGRLARAENALLDLVADHPEKVKRTASCVAGESNSRSTTGNQTNVLYKYSKIPLCLDKTL